MKKFIALQLIVTLILALLLTSCTGTSETQTPIPGGETQSSTSTEVTTSEPASTPILTTEPTPSPTPTPEPGSAKVQLSNSPDSTGNTHFASSHYGLHIAYGNELISMMNYLTILQHGDDIYLLPDSIEDFEYQAEDLQFYSGLLYFLIYDWDNGVYYLYSYDFDNEPVKVSDSTVYHYEFINGKIYFTKEFVQGPIFAMDTNGGSEMQISTMRAHSFVHDDQALYFYATDAGTAPGLVKYDLATNEESIVEFPFYSHNYHVHNGYVYYALDGGTYRSIHRMSLSDQTVTDIWVEMTDWTISMNISDGALYMLVGDSVYKSNLDGSGRTKILQAEDNLQTGLYVFGDRIYCADGAFVYCTLTDGSEVSMFSFNVLQ
ncbi:MAG: DUF5050 domain-containing protein [Clostridiales bacterium]|nr:DUF5050 domain-containing protein [Clostridiales bacterium]